jgi:hypothetical protein
VVDRAAPRVEDQHILDAVGQVERGAVRAKVLLLVAGAEDLDDGGRDRLQGLVGVRRLFTEDRQVRALDRAVGVAETDQRVGSSSFVPNPYCYNRARRLIEASQWFVPRAILERTRSPAPADSSPLRSP